MLLKICNYDHTQKRNIRGAAKWQAWVHILPATLEDNVLRMSRSHRRCHLDLNYCPRLGGAIGMIEGQNEYKAISVIVWEVQGSIRIQTKPNFSTVFVVCCCKCIEFVRFDLQIHTIINTHKTVFFVLSNHVSVYNMPLKSSWAISSSWYISSVEPDALVL